MGRSTLAAISLTKIERFLMALANLRDYDADSLAAFVRQFGHMLTDVPCGEQWDARSEESGIRVLETLRALAKNSDLAARQVEHVPPHSYPPFATPEQIRISELSTEVRRIWRAQTSAEKRLRALLLHERISSTGNPAFLLAAVIGEPLAALGPFAQSILHLLNSADRALVCRNPECPAPLFFRNRRKRRQTYCSPKCSGFGQRQAKLKWWNEKGDKLRRKHKKTAEGKERRP
jgi:hypothetical protein